MFSSILIANRGEIAVRIMRTCRELGIKCIAIYSEVDRDALHVKLADEAYLINSEDPIKSYLDADKIIELAVDLGVEAIHPGYGFLAENHLFAEKCKKRNIKFIGPDSEVLRKVGDKIYAKKIMKEAGIPVVPGTLNEIRSLDEALEITSKIGYPVLIKAAAGGGGIGMASVYNDRDLIEKFRQTQKIAELAFGDNKVYIEKLIRKPRHIEFQIVADNYGNVIHLGERECSVQRRHQKLIEESPSFALTDELRQQMGEFAVKAAKAVKYNNIGTIEFILHNNKFYFLEVNARIQVEHGVTEMRTGIDLVREQIRLALGEPLGYDQEEINFYGWAIECRINVEDPHSNFSPSPGKITRYKEPGGFGVRVDSGIYEGYTIPPYYDSLISKLITWGLTREEAINRMKRALSEYSIKGVKTTIPLHQAILSDKEFVKGKFNTEYISKNLPKITRRLKEIELKNAAIASAVLKALFGSKIMKPKAVTYATTLQRVPRHPLNNNDINNYQMNKWATNGSRWKRPYIK